MIGRMFVHVFACLTFLAFTSIAFAQVDPYLSYATMNNSPAWLAIAPCDYENLDQPVNHQIDVYVRDANNNPLGMPKTDIWLYCPATLWCSGWGFADSDTYPPDLGYTTFSGPLCGGLASFLICDSSPSEVIAQSVSIQTLNLFFSGVDLNGDHAVTLADFTIFRTFYNVPGINGYCADYNKSAGSPSVTLADFAIFGIFYNNCTCLPPP